MDGSVTKAYVSINVCFVVCVLTDNYLPISPGFDAKFHTQKNSAYMWEFQVSYFVMIRRLQSKGQLTRASAYMWV